MERENYWLKYRAEIMGFATLLVMMSHVTNLFNEMPRKIYLITYRGNIGVDIFLFLSGIGMIYSLTKNYKIKEFYKKRIVRILLPYLAICVPFWIIDTIIIKDSLVDFFINCLGISFWLGKGILSVWYVAFIIVVYFITPLFYKIIVRKEKEGSIYLVKKNAIVLLALTILLNVVIAWINEDYYQSTEIAFSRLPIFILGMIFGVILYDKKEIKKSWYALLFCIPIIYVIVLGVSPSAIGMWGFAERTLGGLTSLAIAFGACVIFSRSDMVMRVLRFFGAISLECYLVHVLFLHLINDFIKYKIESSIYEYIPKQAGVCILVYVVLMVLCVLIACAVHKMIDRGVRIDGK